VDGPMDDGRRGDMGRAEAGLFRDANTDADADGGVRWIGRAGALYSLGIDEDNESE